MVTWTTYGTWLQGDKRGYVKNGRILKPDAKMQAANLRNLQKHPLSLTAIQKAIVAKAIASIWLSRIMAHRLNIVSSTIKMRRYQPYENTALMAVCGQVDLISVFVLTKNPCENELITSITTTNPLNV